MKILTATLLLLVLLPLHLFCQSRISGTVTDKQSKQPVDYASVYINGTTNGTLTDSLGNFHLDNVRFPCTLVISHLSYKTQSLNLEYLTSSLNIPMKLKVNEISGVSVQDRNLREQNMRIFKQQFLGTDTWGKYAIIENEEAIQFSRDYITRQSAVVNKKLDYEMRSDPELQWSADSSMVTYSVPANLKAISLQPLKIRLPLLGYTLYYDLVGFMWKYENHYNGDLSAMIGYSFFVPTPFKSKRDSIRILKNREKCYYNSPQHFCKSLYENKLAQNGYLLLEHNEQYLTNDRTASKFYFSDEASTISKNSLPDYKKLKQIKRISLYDNIHLQDDHALVTGLKGRRYGICYYSTPKGQPKDLTLFKGSGGTKSAVIFMQDTCLIRNDGTVPDNSIVFGLTLGSKKVGSMLPEDYQPLK
ncbi:MAG: carboxypeptidase-like regulatory domain-containing protein [Candidatus Saccharibacteria bacterium]